MPPRRVVVDGSNIATEGRSTPSLAQLDEAVRAWLEEHPDDEITVVVDATFAHRIDESERPQYEEAAAHGELVYPPAGAIGRGDAFLLRIAEKTGAIVFSNDSFQEFHGEHEWLFDKGRLIGGTPVRGVGWIFVARTPVRGPKSREAVKEAKRTKARIGSKEASLPMPVPKSPPPRIKKDKALDKAIAVAIEEAEAPDVSDDKKGRSKRRRKRKLSSPPTLPTMNEPLAFLNFVAEHPKPGLLVEAVVESFQSHGAFVTSGDARCYVPLSAMGTPPPRSAREVLRKGDTMTFVLQAYDTPRRGIELALQGHEHLAGEPTEETIEAELASGEAAPAKKATAKKAAPKKAAPKKAAAAAKKKKTEPKKGAAAKKAAAKMPVAKKDSAPKKPAAKKDSAPKKPVAKKDSAPKNVSAKNAGAKKLAAVPEAAGGSAPPAASAIPIVPEAPTLTLVEAVAPPKKKAATSKKPPAKKLSAPKKSSGKPTKKPAAKKPAPTKKSSAAKKAAPKKAVATKKAAPKKKR